MKARLLATMLLVLALATTASGEVTDMALGHDGVLYKLEPKAGELLLTIAPPESSPTVLTVPQTLADDITNPLVALQEESDTIIMVWQEDFTNILSRVMLATYRDGTWFGPRKIDGYELFWASNPTLLVHRSVIAAEDGSAGDDADNADFIHVAWWTGENDDSGGHARCASIPLERGEPLMDEAQWFDLQHLIPYGIACGIVGTDHSLDHPKLFVDPQTGDPHVFFVEVVDCRFGIMQFHAQPDIEKRRRCVVSWLHRRDVAVRPRMSMENSKFDIGYDLSIVLYWDNEDAIDYSTLHGDEGWTDVKRLEITEDLDHERAEELIRRLVR